MQNTKKIRGFVRLSHLEFEAFFNKVFRSFQKRVSAEIKFLENKAGNGLVVPAFRFINQSEDIHSLKALSSEEKRSYPFEQNYLTQIKTLHFALRECEEECDLVTYVKVIRQLMLISHPTLDLFLSSGDLSYAETASHISAFFDLLAQDMQHLIGFFPNIDFVGIKSCLLDLIKDELFAGIGLSSSRRALLKAIQEKVNKLDVTHSRDRYTLIHLAFSYCEMGGPKEIILGRLGVDINRLTTSDKSQLHAAIIGILNGESELNFPILQRLTPRDALRAEEEKYAHQYMRLKLQGFNFSKLQKKLLESMLVFETHIAEQSVLSGNYEPLKAFVALRSQLVKLDPSAVRDCYQMGQLALHFTKTGFTAQNEAGSRIIFSAARSQPDHQKAACAQAFESILPYDPTVIDAIIRRDANTKLTASAQQLGQAGMFKERSDSDEESNTPRLQRKDTAKPGELNLNFT